MKNEPCIKFGIRMRRRIRENPADSRNNSPPSAMLFTPKVSQSDMSELSDAVSWTAIESHWMPVPQPAETTSPNLSSRPRPHSGREPGPMTTDVSIPHGLRPWVPAFAGTTEEFAYSRFLAGGHGREKTGVG